LADFRAMILELVERRTMAHTAKQFVESFAEGGRRVFAAQGAECRIQFTPTLSDGTPTRPACSESILRSVPNTSSLVRENCPP
jgi:hypothetical protein